MGPGSVSPISTSRPPHSGRKGSKKVRTGCITCKIRKVKCDEAKPFCMRCTKTGRSCDGYLDAKTMAQRRRRSGAPVGHGAGAPQAPLTLLYEWASSDERRAFHFFQHVTAPCLSGDLDGAFWRVLVLQICQSEPAVRHAVLAVSSLHEAMVQAAMMTTYVDIEGRSSFALYQYNQAIACLLNQMRTVDARPLVPLLTCVLFVCIELMQSKDRDSLIHLDQGRQILSQLGRKASARNPEIDLIKQHLVPMYTRLSLTSLMFGADPVAIPAPLKTLTEVPMLFETIDEVRYALYDFMDECLRFAKKSHTAKIGEIPPDDLRVFENEQDYLLRKLAKFNVAFSLYRSAKARESPPGSIALIQIHVHTTFIWVSTALNQHETVFDDYVDTFSAIIPLATEFMDTLAAAPASREQLNPGKPGGSALSADTRRLSAMFSFEMHIIAPLYFVAAKCRHPVIRRAALNLLRRNPARRENLWRANVMAAIAERTMRVEEKHLRPPPTESRPQSRSASPPELPEPFPYSLGSGDAWGSGLSDLPFPNSFLRADPGQPAIAVNDRHSLGRSFDGSQYPPVTSSCSASSVTTGSVDAASTDNLGGALSSHMPIDPTLFFDSVEVSSTAHSFSVAPSTASSLDDLGAPASSTGPYVGGTITVAVTSAEQQPPQLWGRVSSSQPPPGIALEPPTPMDGSPFNMSLPLPPSHPHSQPHSRAHSRQASLGSPSVRSDGGSPPLHDALGMGGLEMEMDMGIETLGNLHHYHQQQQGGVDLGGLARGLGLGLNIFGQMSPTATVSRSSDAPFDVPERFRVHESIIGPDKDDGPSWVMMFRKLGGLDADWDVSLEYVAVS
ncbi:hypothetical protein MFIFM68171_10624 [Madurella fahalii]|uniref:Zn(2)-C6 fungal-type domain-containing protein n=1 Tax=Madurella fahalii TaxID=1157608 RepID=A0ABQ0GRQ2_9PEZI